MAEGIKNKQESSSSSKAKRIHYYHPISSNSNFSVDTLLSFHSFEYDEKRAVTREKTWFLKQSRIAVTSVSFVEHPDISPFLDRHAPYVARDDEVRKTPNSSLLTTNYFCGAKNHVQI